LTVTTAEPLDVPLQLDASVSDAIVYVVVVAGFTVRFQGVAVAVSVTPSDQTIVHEELPVRFVRMVLVVPGARLTNAERD
jgi:hypothetical protein